MSRVVFFFNHEANNLGAPRSRPLDKMKVQHAGQTLPPVVVAHSRALQPGFGWADHGDVAERNRGVVGLYDYGQFPHRVEPPAFEDVVDVVAPGEGLLGPLADRLEV